MTSTSTKATKEQVKKAIERTLKKNAELYELLAKYDEENHEKLKKKVGKRKSRD